ncbi:MAG: hydroxymethylbilane synthase [Chloroflexi bacterium]|nr:hydroxymethylbilane synthase [Chloroflexota bacterium]
MTMARARRLGGRASKLSLVQADLASQALAAIGVETEFVPIVTQGDRDRTSSLRSIGGQGVFVRAVESALLNGEIDLAVHSAKDVPPTISEGTILAAYLPRGDVRDALVSRDEIGLLDLPTGAAVGTGSRRRAAQLLRLRADIEVVDIRGNVDTRMGKVEAGEFHAVIVAAAGLRRLERMATEVLPIDLMMPSPGQGALVVQCRAENAEQISAANDVPTCQAVSAERAMLRALGAGCSLPLAALGGVRGGEVLLAGRLLSGDGSERIEVQRSGEDPESVGGEVAEALLERGGQRLMEEDAKS